MGYTSREYFSNDNVLIKLIYTVWQPFFMKLFVVVTQLQGSIWDKLVDAPYQNVILH